MKKQKKTLMRKEQRHAAELRALAKKKKLEEDLAEEEEAEVELLEDELESEVAEEGEEEETQVASLTFDELDAEREVEAETVIVEETAKDVRTLVNNILATDELEPEDKVTALHDIADGFATRIGVGLEEPVDEQKDLELLDLEALIASDHRNSTLAERVEAMTKRVLSTASRKKLPAGKFALPSKRKYPIHDAAHVRDALARAAQQIKRGGQSAADARAALPKIRAAAKRMGIGVANKKKERSAIMIEKDASNQWRWVGWVSNNFLDWDGDIISEDAHKEYIQWWEKNKEVSPVFVSWHTPGTRRKAAVDFMTLEKGFLIMSGPLEETEAANLMKARKVADLGMSHGAFAFGRDPKDARIITKYRMYEVSDLPLENAANPFTDFETIVKEVGMDKQKYLAAILGSDELAEEFLKRTGMKQAALQDAGIPAKEKKEPDAAAAPATEPAPVTEPQTQEPVPAIDETVAKVIKELDLEGLNEFVLKAQEAIEKVPVLEELIKAMQGSQDQKLAELLTPPAARFAWSKEKRASQDPATVVKKDDKLATAAPGVPAEYWLSSLTGTAPIKEEVQ
jgi:hypothetical protein